MEDEEKERSSSPEGELGVGTGEKPIRRKVIGADRTDRGRDGRTREESWLGLCKQFE